jgi:hypothetical protein
MGFIDTDALSQLPYSSAIVLFSETCFRRKNWQEKHF